jgi:CRISPR-associated protein Csm5
MSKYRLTILSPVHISSAEEYELNYNLLQRDGFVYLYDEFILVEFFLAYDITIPPNLQELKNLISHKSDEIINSNLHLRKIEINFSNINKPLLSQITTADFPIMPGSSIKGSLRTAILNCMANNKETCGQIINKCRDKNFDEKRFKKRFDNDLAKIFKYLKITDSLVPLDTKVYKTINVKKNKSHQSNREKKVEEISNYVEAIKPGQSFEIEIKDISEEHIFQNLRQISNKFYIPFFADDEKQYFTKKTDAIEIAKNAQKGMFLINVGRFSGAQRKSLNNLRDIQASKADDKSTTTARTFAIENSSNDKIYYEHELLPFGWIMCEKIENVKNINPMHKRSDISKFQKTKNKAIDNLNDLKQQKLIESEALKDRKKQEQYTQKAIKQKALKQEQEKLSKMSPLERKIEDMVKNNQNPNETMDVIIYNAIKNNKLDEFKCEALKFLKAKMQELKKWVEQSKKPNKYKKYKRTLEVIKMLQECK